MTVLQAFLWILGHLAQTAWRRSGMAQDHFWHVCRNFGVVWSIWPWDDLQGRGRGQGHGAHSWPNSCNDYPRLKAHCYRVMGLISCSWHLAWHARPWHDLDLQCQGRVSEAHSGPTQQKKRSWAYHLPLRKYGPLKFFHALAYKAVSACHLLGIGVSMFLSTYA